jgi:hypothetical protein
MSVAAEVFRTLIASEAGTATMQRRSRVRRPSAQGRPSPVRYARLAGFITKSASMPVPSMRETALAQRARKSNEPLIANSSPVNLGCTGRTSPGGAFLASS